jgi:hypothetical protein
MSFANGEFGKIASSKATAAEKPAFVRWMPARSKEDVSPAQVFTSTRSWGKDDAYSTASVGKKRQAV